MLESIFIKSIKNLVLVNIIETIEVDSDCGNKTIKNSQFYKKSRNKEINYLPSILE